MTLTVRDVCTLLGVPERTVYRWISEETLPAHRVNDQYRVHRTELLEWATARRIKVPAALFDAPEARPEPVPGLVEALRTGGVLHRIGGVDKPSVLRALVEQLPVPEQVDRDFLLHVMLAREDLQSTAIGDGIAIPHVRNPIVQHVPAAMITLCFLERPVDFDALDGRPVQALFSLISPTVRAHLHLLARLSFALLDDGFTRVIARQGTGEEVLAAAARIDGALPPQRARQESTR